MINPLGKLLINQFQRDLPLSPTPFADIALQIGATEDQVIECLSELQSNGFVSRIGPVFNHCSAGASTLAAISVPAEELTQVADIVNCFPEVNHNYEREHEFNLWFVITAPDEERVLAVIDAITAETGYGVLYLPMERSYHIDLAFPIEWKNDPCN